MKTRTYIVWAYFSNPGWVSSHSFIAPEGSTPDDVSKLFVEAAGYGTVVGVTLIGRPYENQDGAMSLVRHFKKFHGNKLSLALTENNLAEHVYQGLTQESRDILWTEEQK